MTTKIDEFSLNLPMVSPTPTFSTEPSPATPSMGQSAAVMPSGDSEETAVTIGNPAPAEVDPKSITVYANSINPVSYSGDVDGIVAFDIVFSVGVNCGESSKTYQVVKRIGIDKRKLAGDVEKETPMSIVETKREEKPRSSPDKSKGHHVETYGGGKYTSVSWHATKDEADAECKRIKDKGAWSGKPPRVVSESVEPPKKAALSEQTIRMRKLAGLE